MDLGNSLLAKWFWIRNNYLKEPTLGLTRENRSDPVTDSESSNTPEIMSSNTHYVTKENKKCESGFPTYLPSGRNAALLQLSCSVEYEQKTDVGLSHY